MYLYLIYLFLFLSLLYSQFDRYKSNIISQYIFFVIFILSFVRWDVGTDWDSYYTYFNSISALEYVDLFSDYASFEYGFEILVRCSKLLSDSYTLFLLIQSLIIFSLYFYSINFLSINIPFTILSLFSINFCNLFFVRQNIAAAIVLYSIVYICKRKYIHFISCIFIASLFHSSAILFILSYFVWNIKFSKLNIIYYFVLCGCLYFVFIYGIDLIANSDTLIRLSGKMMYYKEIDDSVSFGSAYSPSEGFIRGILYRSFQLLLIISFMRSDYNRNDIFRGMVNLYILGVFIYIICFSISPGLIRFSRYFEIVQIFIFPYLIFKFKYLYSRMLVLFLFGMYFVFRLNGVIYNYTDLFIPYKSIFSN